jgi:iron complex transport system ATP-binding protein
MTLTALRAQDLTFRTAGGAAIVDCVSLDIRTGDRMAIIGPNGAGKTTLLKLMCGMSRPSAGSIELDGKPLHGLKPIDAPKRRA